MKFDHVMLDLEAMGTGPRAAIASIGAVKFNRRQLGERFYVRVDLRSSVAAGLEMDAATVLWWLEQSAAARRELTRPGVSLAAALECFAAFVAEDRDVEVWGNGATYDNVILCNAYKALGRPAPWRHWSDRCYRTMKNQAPRVKLERTGTHHNALADAEAQARHLIAIWRRQ